MKRYFSTLVYPVTLILQHCLYSKPWLIIVQVLLHYVVQNTVNSWSLLQPTNTTHSNKTKAMACSQSHISAFSFAKPSLPKPRISPSVPNPRAYPKELYFNHDGSTTKKLLVRILDSSCSTPRICFVFTIFQ